MRYVPHITHSPKYTPEEPERAYHTVYVYKVHPDSIVVAALITFRSQIGLEDLHRKHIEWEHPGDETPCALLKAIPSERRM